MEVSFQEREREQEPDDALLSCDDVAGNEARASREDGRHNADLYSSSSFGGLEEI